VEESDDIRYAELWGRAAAFTLTLREAGIRPGDRVAIFLERDATAVAAYFGVLAAGGVAVIINETMRPRQLEYTLRHSGASLLLTSAELLTRQPRQLELEVPILDITGVDTTREVEPLARESADLAQIIYTSGSTGQPKGVMLTHGNLGSAITAVTSYLGITAEDRTAALLPFSSVYGLNQLLCAIHQASTLVLAASPLPQRVVEKLRRAEVTVLAAVPPLWLQLLTAPGFATPIDSLRILQNAGGHLPEPAIRRLRLQQPQARLFLQYGLTEVIRSTYLSPEEVDRRPASIGRAIPGAEVLVLRDDGAPCAPGEVGELVHRGPTVAAGYWNDPAASAAVFRPDPFREVGSKSAENVVFSGDLVWRDEEGFLYFVGRRDRMIKILGYRVSPDEIANVIYASAEVVEAVVTAEPNEQRGARITAYVVLRPGGSVERLAAFCGIELPRYMQPTRIEVRNALPRTTSGKHDLSALTATPVST
jgi:amino acid adenylation domain-containing protein